MLRIKIHRKFSVVMTVFKNINRFRGKANFSSLYHRIIAATTVITAVKFTMQTIVQVSICIVCYEVHDELL